MEGPTFATIHDEPQGCVQILQDITGSNSQCLKSKLGERGIPTLVALRPIANAVDLAIDLDRQTTIKAGKVENIAADRELPSELQAVWPSP